MYNEIVERVNSVLKNINHTVNGTNYLINGTTNYARVTSVLNAINFDNGSLAAWKKKMAIKSFQKDVPAFGTLQAKDAHAAFVKALDAGDTFATASANFGTKVHSWLETYAITGGFPDLEPDPYSDVYKIFTAVKKFVHDFGFDTDKVKIIKPELFIYHSLGYAGTADCVVFREGGIYLIDYKATNSLKMKYLLQLAAYTEGLRELYGLDVHKAILIRFDKTSGDYERVPVTKEQLATYFEMFKACLMFYRFIQNPSHATVAQLNNTEWLQCVMRGI